VPTKRLFNKFGFLVVSKKSFLDNKVGQIFNMLQCYPSAYHLLKILVAPLFFQLPYYNVSLTLISAMVDILIK
jgi:hypothetical protein